MVDKEHILRVLRIHFQVDNEEIKRDDNRIEIGDDGSVSVWGNVRMTKPAGGRIPVRFDQVGGWFQAERCGLTSFENFPLSCNSLFVAENYLSSFNKCSVGLLSIDIQNNRFENFVGLDTETLDLIEATGNPLKSLEGLPETPPEEPLRIGITYRKDLPLLRLLVATEIDILDPQRSYKRFEPVQSILRNYAGQGKRAMFDCQKDLEDAGFEENARW